MRKYLKLSMFLFLAVLIVSISCIGCSSTSTTSKAPYVIGAIFSLTGSQSNLGIPEENTVNMIVTQINKKGGINGHNLSVILYDDGSLADTAATLATKLIEQDQVLAIIGPTTTGSTLAIMSIRQSLVILR